MSDLPSWLKSPVSTICQPAPPAPAEPPPICVVPFISQIQRPVPLFCCHRMSALPSLLKSLLTAPPVPGSVPKDLFKNSTADPLKGAVNVCALDPPETVAPVIVAPVETFNHSVVKVEPDPVERLTVKLPPF